MLLPIKKTGAAKRRPARRSSRWSEDGGPGGTRTPEGVCHLIYSQARLTTSLPTHVWPFYRSWRALHNLEIRPMAAEKALWSPLLDKSFWLYRLPPSFSPRMRLSTTVA